jgi:excisionase family DNA binding protein
MFRELEEILKNVEGDLKYLTSKIEGLERITDRLNSKISSIEESVNGDVQFYNRKNVAETLGVSIDTITNYINKGELECIRLGRRILIEKKALISFIDKNTQK